MPETINTDTIINKTENKILTYESVEISFGGRTVVQDVNFSLKSGEILGLVGESGSGKSVTSLSIMGLLAYPGRVKDGEILFNGEDLLKKKKSEMRKIQGDHIAMIFQDPLSSLNPIKKIGKQISEIFTVLYKEPKKEAEKKALELMRAVGIPEPEKR